MAGTGGAGGRGRGSRERAVSEFTGVAILVALTLLVTGSVGLVVLIDPASKDVGRNANFSFQYIDRSSTLIVTHDRGDPFDAGNLTLEGRDDTATWAELAGDDTNATVGPGDTIQLSRRNAWGSPVSANGKVSVIYRPPVGNETVLDTWRGSG